MVTIVVNSTDTIQSLKLKVRNKCLYIPIAHTSSLLSMYVATDSRPVWVVSSEQILTHGGNDLTSRTDTTLGDAGVLPGDTILLLVDNTPRDHVCVILVD
jgi:hypothetical protein